MSINLRYHAYPVSILLALRIKDSFSGFSGLSRTFTFQSSFSYQFPSESCRTCSSAIHKGLKLNTKDWQFYVQICVCTMHDVNNIWHYQGLWLVAIDIFSPLPPFSLSFSFSLSLSSLSLSLSRFVFSHHPSVAAFFYYCNSFFRSLLAPSIYRANFFFQNVFTLFSNYDYAFIFHQNLRSQQT